MKSAVVVLLLLICFGSSRAQQARTDSSYAAIISSEGPIYWGRILEETGDTVFFRSDDGIAMQLPRAAIDEILYGKKHINSFWEAGVVLGTPALINIVGGYQWKSIGIRVSGLYGGRDSYGLQVSAPYNLYRGLHSSHDVSVLYMDAPTISLSADNGATFTPYRGVGLAYDLILSGFCFEVGLLKFTSSPDFSILAQIGYVYQFR
jgi:hypothetical protein